MRVVTGPAAPTIAPRHATPLPIAVPPVYGTVMHEEALRYDRMVERALRGVVRQALEQVAASGLPGDHHFYITFSTTYPDVEIPGYLRAKYADEMTIVIQYQFYGLEVFLDRFEVTLSFNNRRERLSIPFNAVSTFADPSVNFALQFQPLMSDLEDDEADSDVDEEAPPPSRRGLPALAPVRSDQDPSPRDNTGDAGRDDDDQAHGDKNRSDNKVVPLDSFRKK